VSALLEVAELSAGYGEAVVLEAVSLSLAEGESLALLGRNGVGKSTLITTLMGLTTRHAGSIVFAGREMGRAAPFVRARAGLGWVPQERGVFPSLTVAEHLRVVARPGAWDERRVYELFPALSARSRNRGDQLSCGEQQMLAIGRALVTNPRLLLLDEPMEGLAPAIVEQLGRAIRQLRDRTRMSIILVEQHARLALALTDPASCSTAAASSIAARAPRSRPTQPCKNACSPWGDNPAAGATARRPAPLARWGFCPAASGRWLSIVRVAPAIYHDGLYDPLPKAVSRAWRAARSAAVHPGMRRGGPGRRLLHGLCRHLRARSRER
jgi:branched-chain amino acid transport system ATP-binding protein